MSGDLKGVAFPTTGEVIKAQAETIVRLLADRDALRVRLFANRQTDSADHTTACSIWGDDGQGGTVEYFPEPLPCNCGSLINWNKARALASEAETVRLTGLLEEMECLTCGEYLTVGPGGVDCPACNPNPARG